MCVCVCVGLYAHTYIQTNTWTSLFLEKLVVVELLNIRILRTEESIFMFTKARHWNYPEADESSSHPNTRVS